MLAQIEADAEAFILDLGCGKGELLIRLLERYPAVRAHGVDRNPEFIAQAAAAARSRLGQAAHLTFELADVKKLTVHAGSLSVVVCIGSTWLFGNFAQALRNFHTMLRAGGVALVGEGYWKRKPGAAYLENLDEGRESELNDNAGNLQAAVACGFTPLAVAVSSDDDWDAYERTWGESLVEYVAANPTDPDVKAILQRAYQGRDNYVLHGGRETLGFGLYLLKKR